MATEYKLPYTANEINEKLEKIDENTTNISKLSGQIDDLSKGEISISNYGLTAKDLGGGVVEILLTAIASTGVTQSGNTLIIIDGVTAAQNGSTLAIA